MNARRKRARARAGEGYYRILGVKQLPKRREVDWPSYEATVDGDYEQTPETAVEKVLRVAREHFRDHYGAAEMQLIRDMADAAGMSVDPEGKVQRKAR